MESTDIRAASPSEGDGSLPRRRSVVVQDVGSGIRAYTPTLWQARMRREGAQKAKQERDSLRSRSNEGRPGSRKNRRYTRSQEVLSTFRRSLAVQADMSEEELAALIKEANEYEHRPSAFYYLMHREGPERALEVWASLEASRGRPRSRPRRPKTTAQVVRENRRSARNAFADNWKYVQSDAKDFLLTLEGLVAQVFRLDVSGDAGGAPEGPSDQGRPEQWVLSWDGEAFAAVAGSAPAAELVLLGLDGGRRRVVHQFAKWLGLRSESQEMDSGLDSKALVLSPPACHSAAVAWTAPFSVAPVLSAH